VGALAAGCGQANVRECAGISMRNIGKKWLLALGVVGLSSVAPSAHAFKTGTHSATATEVVRQLSAGVNASGGNLHFEIDGRPLDIKVTEAEAYAAVLANPDFFRAGAVGPDAFPDPLTGQIMMHGDQSDMVKDIVEKISGVRPPLHDHADFFENRKGPAEFRSIDFATAMLEFLNTRYNAVGAERAQILAFIMGYLSHGVGDSFAHTWVNELAGGSWSLSKGKGLWGPFSEEIKHVAVETMVDKLVPSDLKDVAGDGGGQTLIRLRAPVKFLDAFYSSLPLHSGLAPYSPSGGLKGFIDHYKNFNSYHGGFFYNYLNAQTQVAPSLKSWSGLGGVFDLAEDINDNKFVNFGLDLAELPEDVLSWLSIGNPIGWVDELTGGFIDCHADPASGFPTPIKDLREALDYVGGINDRIGLHSKKSEIVRRNWVRLSQCTSENLARSGAKDFDPEKPAFNHDSCADVVRAGWIDQGNPDGLDRGDIRPRSNVASIAYIDLNEDERFLLDLKAAFLGEDAEDLFLLVNDPINNHGVWETDEAMEGKNQHRSIGKNLERMLDYVADFGFRVDELSEIIQPGNDRSVKEDYDSFCSAARDPGFERCLDIAFGPIAATGRAIACSAEHLACTTSNVKTCLQNACNDACPFSNSSCGDLCGTGEPSGCEKKCDDWFCVEACFPFTDACVDLCEPVLHTSCNLVCGLFSSEKDTCAEAVLDEAVCGVEAVKCNVDNLAATITNDNYADKLLVPARKACDTVDEALRLFKCLKGDPNLSQDQQDANRRDCVIDLCTKQTDFSKTKCTETYDQVKKGYDDAIQVKDAVSAVADALKQRPPHEVVNLAFILEDSKKSPQYLAALQSSIASTKANWVNNPPPATAPQAEKDLYARKGKVITRWQKLANDIQTLGTSPDPLTDFTNASNEAADLIRQSTELGLIPTVIGPTAQQIYADIGPKFKETFLPFFNALQGMKLAPLTRKDVEVAFTNNANVEGTPRLPWFTDKNSPACSGAGASPYCDVFKSFDEPNCLDCAGASLLPDPNRFGWVPGRGMVAWNNYTSDNPVRHITTALPFANSNDAYDNLYTRIFQVPPGVPEFAGFDDPDAPWTSQQLPLSTNTGNKTQGAGSLQVDKCGTGTLDSPVFNTADWGAVGDKLKLDVFIPAPQQSPYWVGGLEFFITVTPADLVYQSIGYKDLTTLPRGQWSTLEFAVPPQLRTAMLGDFSRARFNIQLNYTDCAHPILLDNIRFGGNVTKRQNYHLRGSQKHSVTTNPLFSFDDVGSWGSNTPVTASATKVQGSGSLAVNASWWTPVTSRPFNINELVGVTRRLSLDIFVPKPSGDSYWGGSIQLYATCGGISNAYIGQYGLTNRFEGEFNTAEFTLPDDLYQVLRGARGPAANCSFTVQVGVNPGGTWLLDNMGFY
jgi:hypothetical protein